jgi:hypothetical protein
MMGVVKTFMKLSRQHHGGAYFGVMRSAALTPLQCSHGSVHSSLLLKSHFRLFSPKGAAPQSPGLVRTYPGCMNVALFNPKGVASQTTFTGLWRDESQPLQG